MNPFFFGNSAEPLYGVYHPPSVTPTRPEAILLCAPFGQEYMRSHRALRQLALLLNKQGFGVLRFDYKGTGDSYGDIEEASIQDWVENIHIAAEELQHTAQVEKISLVGLRLGGLIATKACAEIPHLNSLVLWDTIVSGDRYIEELQLDIENSPESKSKYVDEQGNLHFNGFPLYKRQLDALRQIDLTTLNPSARRVIQICSAENQNQTTLKESWAKHKHCEFHLVPAPGDWNFVDDFGGILLPQQIIQAIVTCLKSDTDSN